MPCCKLDTIPLNMWERFTTILTCRSLNKPCLPAANSWRADAQRRNTNITWGGCCSYRKYIFVCVCWWLWFTFRMFICFLKRSEKTFFLFEPSSSLLPASPSSYLQGVISASIYRFTTTLRYIRKSKWDKCHYSCPAFQSRIPSFLLHKGPAGSRTVLWARCSELQSWCWVQPPSPAGLAQLWGYYSSRRRRHSLASCPQRTWRWWHGDNWWEDKRLCLLKTKCEERLVIQLL